MTKRKKPKTADWRNLPIEKWNSTTFHAYLADLNEEKYGVEYVPFGKGSVGQRWSVEKRNIKLEIEKKGPEVVKAFIDECFANHRQNPNYPVLAWGFMYSYKRDLMAKAQSRVQKQAKREPEETEVDEDWF